MPQFIRPRRPMLLPATSAGTCLLLLCLGSLSAVEPSASETVSEAATTGLTLLDIIRLGGFLMYVLAGISILALALALFYAITLRKEALIPARFFSEATDAAHNQGVDGLAAVCRRFDCPAARAIMAGIQQARRSTQPDPQMVLGAIEAEGNRQAQKLWRRIQYLNDLGVIAPMVGLLGTVLGMIRSFNAIYLQYGTSKPVTLAGGVAQALITTATGLAIAIPCLLLYSFFRGRTSYLIGQMEERCEALSAHILNEQ
ncbi:MAG: MotA/TolQ/ExbB proton channel family protein [Verrucomicrobiota bacterium]|nr:MotA/TolQ/ExbB proton channel family protein [Verrucomicrobiota bacterium]MDD8050756.1 MotA/TolQ/ExbB proton channel family protein [Verrucomicrobiota bacterium]